MNRLGLLSLRLEHRGREAADRGPVVEATDHVLDLHDTQVRPLAPDLNQKLLDPVGVTAARRVGPASCLHFGEQFLHGVHLPIIGDLRSLPQVMRRFMIPRVRLKHEPLA